MHLISIKKGRMERIENNIMSQGGIGSLEECSLWIKNEMKE